MAAPLSFLLYAAVALAWGAVSRWLGRPIPGRLFVVFLALPILFLLPAFVTTRQAREEDRAVSGDVGSEECRVLLPVARANGPFLSVAVPRGTHTVRLKYAPPGSRAGAAVSLASVFAAAIAAVRSARRPQL